MERLVRYALGLSILAMVAVYTIFIRQTEPYFEGEKLSLWKKRLDSELPSMRVKAVVAVTQLSPQDDEAGRAVVRLFLHDEEESVSRAAREMTHSRFELPGPGRQERQAEVIDALIAALRGPDLRGRRRAPDALNRLLWLSRSDASPQRAGEKKPQAVEALAAALADDDRQVRLAAARALWLAGPLPDGAAEALVKMLAGTDRDEQLAALRLSPAVKAPPASALPVLLRLASSKDPQVATEAGPALEALGGVAISPLLGWLAGDDARLRERAARLLSWQFREVPRLSDADLSAVLALLGTAHQDARGAVFRLLRSERRRALPGLAEALRSGKAPADERAAAVLALIGRAAEPVLEKAALQGPERARKLAAAALLYRRLPARRAALLVGHSAAGPLAAAACATAENLDALAEALPILELPPQGEGR